MAGLTAAQKHVSFPTPDGGLIYADLYGDGGRGVVLAHGAQFDKSSWEKQARVLEKAGFRVLAIDFRGYGQSRGGAPSQSRYAELYIDVLAAVRYLHENGAKTVSVIGGSMGGGAAGAAAVASKPGEIDRLVLLAPAPIDEPQKLKGRKLFLTSRGDPRADKIREEYEKAPEPKELYILDGSAHAQHIFATEQGERLMREILRFLNEP
jgi:alpha-beta hydrolase superfamily lysophospholipase